MDFFFEIPYSNHEKIPEGISGEYMKTFLGKFLRKFLTESLKKFLGAVG